MRLDMKRRQTPIDDRKIRPFRRQKCSLFGLPGGCCPRTRRFKIAVERKRRKSLSCGLPLCIL